MSEARTHNTWRGVHDLHMPHLMSYDECAGEPFIPVEGAGAGGVADASYRRISWGEGQHEIDVLNKIVLNISLY